MKKFITLIISVVLIFTCVMPVSAALCNHDTSGQTLYRDSDHPHNTFRRCKICNKKVYTGNTYTVSDCSICDDGVVSMSWPTESLTITSLSGGQYSSSHPPIDIMPLVPGTNGDEVYAMYDGEILEFEYETSAGNTCHINHDNPNRESSTSSDAYIYSRYSHLVSSPAQYDEEVSAGELIGYMGNSGETVGSTGPDKGSHLHFETHVDDEAFTSNRLWSSGTAVNPQTYFYFIYPGNSFRTAEIPVEEPFNINMITVDEEVVYNDARGPINTTINYEIAPDMYVDIEWVANMTIQECNDNNIDKDAVQYFINAIDSMTEVNDHYDDLYTKLLNLYELMS